MLPNGIWRCLNSIFSSIKPISDLSKCHFTYNYTTYVTFLFLDHKQTLTDCCRRSYNLTVGSKSLSVFSKTLRQKNKIWEVLPRIFFLFSRENEKRWEKYFCKNFCIFFLIKDALYICTGTVRVVDLIVLLV